MAVQYSLSYDAQGNPSLVKNTTTGSAPVIKTDNFTVGEYTPKRSIMTDFDFEDAFSPEQQYKILQTYIADNDADPGNDTNTGGPDIFKKKYTLNEQQKINSLMMAGLDQEVEDYKKYVTRSKTAKGLKTASMFLPAPFGTILSIGSTFVGNQSDKKVTEIIDSYYASDYYQDMVKQMDYEYDAYGDYDVYHDGSYNMGPTYNRDDLKTGTVFDAEDHGEPPAGVDPSTVTIQDVDDYGTYEPSTPKHHGDSHQQTFSGGSEGGEFDTSNNNTGSSYSRPGASGHPTGHHW